ncbi:YbaB/EbfC family nucleoid-associated protein [Actinophytocola sp.]|uniref:YbaB/EbfC family nucleoid-associated protein n=1 Tax=Actinophytocola sp. TaxID=1872138 RepID=UPI003D6BFD7D
MSDPLSATERMVDDWQRGANQKAERFQQLADRVEQVSITESVAGGAVSVTVGHNGLPTDVSMTERVRQMSPDEIAANVMAAIRKAQSRYPERLAEIVADTVGEDDPASQHIMAKAHETFPPPEESEEEPTEDEPLRFSDGDTEDTGGDQPPPPRRSPPRRPMPGQVEDDEDDDGSIFRG